MTTFDIEQPDQLLAYLRQHNHIAAAEKVTITLLAGGVSNRTVLVERTGGEAWVIKQALAKLRVAVDWFSSPERIHREAAGMRALTDLLPPGSVPSLVFEDHEAHLLAMQAVPQPHANWKAMLLAGDLHIDHVQQFAQTLGAMHGHSFQNKDELAPIFSDRTFFETLRLEPYYLYTSGQHPDVAEFYTHLVDETRAQSLALVHGDYSPKNVLVHLNRLMLLDHEVIHWGDPCFDLGFSFTHLLSKAHHVAAARQAFIDAAQHYWRVYVDSVDDLAALADFEPRAVRHTLACLLARVDGRSPLEYLTLKEKERQRRLVLALMGDPPTTLPDLIHAFHQGL